MSPHAFFRFGWLLALLLGACGPIAQVPDVPQASPVSAGEWTVKLTQSGGFAGVMLTVQVSSDGNLVAENQRAGRSVTKTLPAETVARIARYYSQLQAATAVAPHSGCADCFLYHLDLGPGAHGSRIIEADDTTLGGSGAADLIRLLQQLRDEALKAGS